MTKILNFLNNIFATLARLINNIFGRKTAIFSIDSIKLAASYVEQDLYDDFWPDIFNYKDYLQRPDLIGKINFTKYSPKPISAIDVPKPTYVLRPGHFISFVDRVYYQLLIGGFAKSLDDQLASRGVSFGYRTSRKKKYFIDNNIENWKKFIGRDEQNFHDKPDGKLLVTDLSAFFEHIRFEHILERLNLYEVDSNIVSRLRKLLLFWNPSGIGIPQGNNCSSFLANVYLDEIDKAMLDDGYNYYRFVDDIRIFADDERTLRMAAARLTELLRPLNLHLNGGKTELRDLAKHQSRKNEFADEMAAIEYGIETGVVGFMDGTENKLKELWAATVSSSHLDKTKFKYCVNRFRKIGSDFLRR
jgi:hypothetical protein